MRINSVLAFLVKNRLFSKSFPLQFKAILSKNDHIFKKQNFSTTINCKYKSTIDDENSDSDMEPELDLMDTYNIELNQKYVRNLLYKNTNDLLILRLKECASIQEVFTVFNCNLNEFRGEHILQSVLVLCDLKNIFYDLNLSSAGTENSTQISNEFIQQLNTSDTFKKLLKLIEKKSNTFDTELLSYLVLYLNKIGLQIDSCSLLQQLLHKLEKKLIENFQIEYASRYFETIYNPHHLRTHFMCLNLVPLVFDEIGKCDSNSKLNNLTISLNKINLFVTSQSMEKYKNLIEKFLAKQKLTYHDYKVILNIIAFLNYPKWRSENTVLISKLILIMKNHLNLLDVYELNLLYDIFFKIQQPGEILSELQRCTSRYLQQLDDIGLPQKISLFSSLIFFTSPTLRFQFQKSLSKYVQQSNNIDSLILLCRILAYVKINDHKLCKDYFKKVLNNLKKDGGNASLLKVAHNYINFNLDIENFQYKEFETEMCNIMESETMNNVEIRYFPHKLVSVLSFVMVYGKKMEFLEYLVTKCEENWEQLNNIDALKLSLCLRSVNNIEKKYEKLMYINRINTLINRIIKKEQKNSELSTHNNSLLLKASIFQSNVNTKIVEKMLLNYKDITITSKTIENICYCFMMTSSLIPEVMERVSEYLIKYKEFLLGFNVEKILYMFYSLGYSPKNPEFFDTATNIIIRDQERIGGLSLLHCGIALCYFNKLPKYLIKSIFNVEFLDKLDTELENCYSKEKYPQRVRNNLMQLNRAVCLDYPEANVPWFHKKYIEELYNSENNTRNKLFPARVKEYLQQTINDDCIFQNVITPYGYRVYFVIYLNERDQVVFDPAESKTKLAFLLLPQYCFTKVDVRLRGKIQLKKRHLEILGYKVVFINFSDWISMFYADERIDFLSRLIWPKIKVYR